MKKPDGQCFPSLFKNPFVIGGRNLQCFQRFGYAITLCRVATRLLLKYNKGRTGLYGRPRAILRTSGTADAGDGFQGGVQEKVQHGLFATVSDYGIQIVAWSDSVEQDGRLSS